jgi:Ca-activated chloride channel family protein
MKLIQQRLAGCLLLATILGSCKQVASQQNPGEASANMQDPTTPVSWQARPGNIYFNREEGSGYYYLYVNVRGNEWASKRKRVPLNISLVLDRSGSMAGSKIAYAKKAAAFVVDQLNSEDIVSVVNYDDRVEVTSSAQPVKNKELLKQKINELFDRGSTNLTGGMLEGYTQVKANRKEGYVNRVLLLTDGLANQGITDPAQMKKIVEKKYAEDGIALSTFGLGADYNEDLLTILAEMGRANYYFIDNPDKIPAIFASELKGLLSVVAQNTWVEVDIPQQLECDKVYGYPFERKGSKIIVRLNDLFANDEKGILIRCRRTQIVSGTLSFNCQLHFTDAVSFNSMAKEKTIVIRPADDHTLLREGEDMMVQEMIALFESTEAFDDVMTKVDAGDYDRARQVANAALYKLQEKQKTIRSEKLKKQEETLSTYTKRIEEVKTMREEDKKIYQKSNKAVNYGVKKGKQ